MNLKDYIRDVPDFPKPGILFKDISPLLLSPEALAFTLESLASHYRQSGIQKVAAMEARGYLFGVPLAQALKVGFVMLRKPGKLPWKTWRETYQLEYGSDSLEVHQDAIAKGEKVLIVDDLLATGGTAAGASHLVERCGGIVAGLAFVIELTFLEGRQALGERPIHSLITY